MKKIDKDGLLLCDLQAKAFEMSCESLSVSSAIFIRRFMHSDIAKEMDNLAVLQTNLQAKDILDRVNEEYGVSEYGSVKYTPNELYWIGYIYRYYAYTYDRTSTQVYRTVKPKELRGLFLPYHTLDPAQAIDRILEAKGMAAGIDEEMRQFEIYKRIRG
ncbi:MAG: antitoxin [Lachnospiraceae bacterium]|nr:antitoxin [Lachnospiraceae bacterium]